MPDRENRIKVDRNNISEGESITLNIIVKDIDSVSDIVLPNIPNFKIVSGPNGVAGEWGHNQINHLISKKENFESTNLREGEIESFMSGLSLAKKFNNQYKKNLKTNEIFELYRKHDLDAENLIDNFKVNLAMSLANIINILDPDCFVFGGGVSNEIDFLSEIETIVRKFVTGREYEGVFLKPKYGDASGVRGAARLGRKSIY